MPTSTFFNLPPDKRRRVIDAALVEFAEVPYEAASISRIVARAGIAKGSFYQYFSSKADLFEHLAFEELGKQKIAYLQAHPPAEGADFFGTLAAMTVAGIRWALDHPRLARMADALQARTSDTELRPILERSRRLGHLAMVALLEQGIAAGQVRADLPIDVAASILAATLQQGSDEALRARFGLDVVGLMHDPDRAEAVDDGALAEVVDALVDVLRRGLGGDAKGPFHAGSFDMDAYLSEPT